MINVNILLGRVVGVVHSERNDLLIIEETSSPDYPQKVACEFYGDKRKEIEGVSNGELVRVAGSTRSREYQGKWFTTFSAYKVTKAVVPYAGAPGATPPARGEDIPF
jgi:hypothetical protein